MHYPRANCAYHKMRSGMDCLGWPSMSDVPLGLVRVLAQSIQVVICYMYLDFWGPREA